MKKIFLINFLFVPALTGIFHPASAQTNYSRQLATTVTIKGTVTAAVTGLPLNGASIYIPDLKIGAIADSGGHYTLRNVPAGTYLIQAGYIGYKNSVKTVTLDHDMTVNFILEISITEETDVVVTGVSQATTIKRDPVPIVAIDHRYLQQNLSTNVIDAIAKVPGVNAVTTGPNVSKPFIRGLGYNRILTLYDGVRQEGQQWGDEHGIEVDENSVNKIEVVKGPASLIYGSDAEAGVVNLLPPPPPPDGKTVGNISGEYQTNNNLVASSVNVAGNKNGITWMGIGSYKMAADYRNKIDGRVYNTAYRELDFSGSVGINRSWGYSHLGVTAFNDLQEIPDGSRDSATRQFTKQITEIDTARPIVTPAELKSYDITPLHQHVQYYRAYLKNNFILGNSRLELNLAVEKSIRQEFSHPEYPSIPGLDLVLNTYAYDVKYFFPERNGWSVTSGVNGMYQTNSVTKGTEFVIPSYHQLDVGPFFFIKKSISNLELAGGVRYDIRRFNNQQLYTQPDPVTGFDTPVYGADTAGADNPFYAYTHTFAGASGSLGASYKFSDKFSGKVNVGRGYRSPNISEISANGVHPGTNTFQKGNLDFKPEFNWQEDIGVNFSSPHVTIDASVFNNNIQNYIYNEKIGSSTGQAVVIDTFQFEQSKARLYGGELSVDIHPHPLDWLHFENSLSLVYGDNLGGNGQKITDSSK
ncbi:MAG TPA: TonB-dependent receptor, partial [Chitinophagaceae bacterium]|nr:TonB-dependent receptor [Chitinophagaceae bacterium]